MRAHKDNINNIKVVIDPIISGTPFILLLNIDHDRPNIASVQVNDPQQPFLANIDIVIQGKNIEGTIKEFYPHGQINKEVILPTEGKYYGKLEDNYLKGTWKTDVNTEGEFELVRKEDLIISPPDQAMKWEDFRNWALKEVKKKKSLIFRGHKSSSKPLITSFHRTGRRSLIRYSKEDVPRLGRFIEAVLNTRYDLNDPTEYGSLLNLFIVLPQARFF